MESGVDIKLHFVDNAAKNMIPTIGDVSPVVSLSSAQSQKGRSPAPAAAVAAKQPAPAEHGTYSQKQLEPRSSGGYFPERQANQEAIAHQFQPQQFKQFDYLRPESSVRGRELSTRQRQLEQRLDVLNNRLKLADSLMTQIDIRLEKARLEQDLELLSDKIQRLHLKEIYETPPEPVEMAGERGDTVNTPSEIAQKASVNLIA